MKSGNIHIIIKLTLGSVHVVLAVPPRREGGGQEGHCIHVGLD